MKKIAIYIDGSNLSAASKAAGFRMDYKKVYDYWAKQGQVIDACYFTAVPPKGVESTLLKLVDWLSYNGWNVKKKETTDQLSDSGLFHRKGNMDIEIAVRALSNPNMTHFVLFSGDGDFRCLVEELQNRGVHVTAVSHLSRGTSNITSDILRRQVNVFMNLGHHRDIFEKVHGKQNNGS